MEFLPTPAQTPTARAWLAQRDTRLRPAEQALLATIDGHRNVIELESVARAMGLGATALDALLQRGLIEFEDVPAVTDTSAALQD